MPISNKKPEYTKWLPIWETTRDAIAGQEVIKGKSTTYLPKLPGQPDDSYLGYLSRAQFINYSSRTLQTALGQIFRKKPVINNSEEIQDLLENIDLSGRNLDYFSREVVSDVLTVNRAGVLVDYSENYQRPYLVFFPAETIINWRTSHYNGMTKLSLVVVQGIVDKVSESDPYKTNPVIVWREFFLDENGFYSVRDWSQQGNEFIPSEILTPLKNGKRLDFIPFYIINTNSIYPNIIKAPMLDFVNLNLGHYKNDADYENMLHLCGCKTVIAKGWEDGKAFPMGGCANFGTDGDAHFLEASADSALLEELRHKEEQMAVLGSSLLSGKGRYVASGETQRLQSEGEFATLADVSIGASVAFTKILQLFSDWAGITNFEEINIEFNTDFETSELNPQELTAWMAAVQAGLMSMDTYYYNMNKKEVYPFDSTLEKEIDLINKTMEMQIERRDMTMTDMSDEETDTSTGNDANR